MADPEQGTAALRSLRKIGVTVAIDDFGTGHSSLAHVASLPIDELKIDRSFVSRIEGEQGSAIAAAMSTLASTLRLTAIAEGVETQAQADRLAELGYPLAQGFHFSRPREEQSLRRLLRERRPALAV
jgi:EAL domain-containing protein (putative c-di-GMP-specific phosphodiesterase class I)